MLEQTENVQCVHSNQLYRLSWPFLILMRLGGMFFVQPGPVRLTHASTKVHPSPTVSVIHSSSAVDNDPNDDDLSRQFVRKPSRKWGELFERCSMYYSFALLLLGLGYGAKFIYSFFYGVHLLHFTNRDLGTIVNYCAEALWILQMIVTHVMFLRVCLRPSKLTELLVSWERLRFLCPMEHCECPSFGEKFRERRNWICGIAVLHCLLQLWTIDFPLFIPTEQYSEVKSHLMNGFRIDNSAVIVLNLFGGLYTTLIYVVPCYFFSLIVMTIVIDYDHLTHDFAASQQEDGRLTIKTLEWFRIRHNSLCILVDIADDVFSPWIALTLACSIFQVLASIFVLAAIGSQLKVLTDLNNLYWLLTYFLQMAIILYRSGLVEEAAHGTLHRLYQIDQTQLTIPESLQLQTFLSKLTTNRIGFTAWKMVALNWEALLMVLGTYVTYQILLFQLQLDLGLDAKVESITEVCSVSGKEENLPMSFNST